MKPSRACFSAATAVASLLAAGAACASTSTLLYSFETLYNSGTPAGPNGNPPAVPPAPDPNGTRPDDFHFNGNNTTVTQDTVGATDQTHSLEFVQAMSETFDGAVTELLPSQLNNDNSAITMDITVPSTGNFAGNFANMGIKEFGSNPNLGPLGGDIQTIGEAEASIALSPGTHHVGIPLIGLTNPLTFDQHVSFASAFGPDTNTQMTPTGWEFYVNKSNDSALTVYVDNVRIVPMLTGDLNYDGRVNALDFAILAANFGIHGTQATIGRGDVNDDNTIDSQDFILLADNFNQVSPSASLDSAVPEPLGAVQISCCAVGVLGVLRQRRGRKLVWVVNSGCIA